MKQVQLDAAVSVAACLFDWGQGRNRTLRGIASKLLAPRAQSAPGLLHVGQGETVQKMESVMPDGWREEYFA